MGLLERLFKKKDVRNVRPKHAHDAQPRVRLAGFASSTQQAERMASIRRANQNGQGSRRTN